MLCFACDINTDETMILPIGVQMLISTNTAKFRYDEKSQYSTIYMIEPTKQKSISLPYKCDRKL